MRFLVSYPDVVAQLTWQHLQLVLLPLILATLISLPLGWVLHRSPRLAWGVLGVLNFIYTIPSLALMIFLIPWLGLNARAVMAALTLYSEIIILRNVLAGLAGVDAAILEAARGMGMTRFQVAWRVQLPLALPVILTGVRLAAILAIAIAAIGSKFGAGGLGTLLFEGIAQAGRMDKVWVGALGVAALALAFNYGLLWLERRLTPYRTVLPA
ncbi:MAG: ABC transporter permease [Thermanaerothrix sp.]|nr:ABC transporter permease [Thermanaerothrix sp.]